MFPFFRVQPCILICLCSIQQFLVCIVEGFSSCLSVRKPIYLPLQIRLATFFYWWYWGSLLAQMHSCRYRRTVISVPPSSCSTCLVDRVLCSGCFRSLTSLTGMSCSPMCTTLASHFWAFLLVLRHEIVWAFVTHAMSCPAGLTRLQVERWGVPLAHFHHGFSLRIVACASDAAFLGAKHLVS